MGKRLWRLRAASLHEAQNFLSHMTFLIQNAKFKIQNWVKRESGIEPLSRFFISEFSEFKDYP